ncbi:MAG: ACT domain-containing protein [Lapillicoccus sp.]
MSDPFRPAAAVPTGPPEDEQTLRVTISGDDRPGLTSALFDAIADVGAEVRDLEQVVVRGQLTLAMLLAAGPETDRLEEVVRNVAHSLDLMVKTRRGTGDNAPGV